MCPEDRRDAPESEHCLNQLYFYVLPQTEELTEEVIEILRGHESQISALEQINIEADRLEWVDSMILDVQRLVRFRSYQITSQTPGILDDFDKGPIPFSPFVELSHDTHKMQFIYPGRTLESMCSLLRYFAIFLKDKGMSMRTRSC